MATNSDPPLDLDQNSQPAMNGTASNPEAIPQPSPSIPANVPPAPANVPPRASTSTPRELRLSPEAKRNWKKIFKRLSIVTLPKRASAAASKNAGVPCDRCALMKLTEAKFLILDFAKHRRIDRSKDIFSDPSSDDGLGPEGLEFGPKEFKLGILRDIYPKRDNCGFCRLVVNSLTDVLENFLRGRSGNTEEKFYLQDTAVSVSWQIDGRILLRNQDNSIKGSRPCTRRLRLRWDDPTWPDFFVVLMERKNTTQSLFLARSTDNFRKDAALVGRWLRFCDDFHDEMCSPISPNTLASKPFLGVIDVKEMRLSKLPQGARYVALSYTWGTAPWQFKTKRGNIKSLMAPGGLNEWKDTMPRTIRDSMELVTNLGERYLWVDALCIIQDSDRSWALNSNVMNIVYGNAYFTICAADGDSANAGLKALNNDSRIQQNLAFYNKDLRLKCLQPAEHFIQQSKWNTRGWTFQERLLSPRTLLFVKGRMFFQCRCTARSVDIITEDENAGWSIEFNQSPSLMLQKLVHQPLLVYKQALQLYMKRELTFQKDILAAFTGIGNLVCETLGGSLMFGLPSSHFDWALLWEFKSAAARRPRENQEYFPSWSWCGWRNKGMDCEYKSQMLAGIEDNLHDWLMNHTWITWYVRDGNGNLRLVWNGSTAKKHGSKVESTWRGYTLPPNRDPEQDDAYGRRIRESQKDKVRDKNFALILDECPFAVEIVPETESYAPNSAVKDMPFLQFYTWSAFFRIREDRRTVYTDQNFRRYNIEDYKNDWCGTIMLDSVWVVKKDFELDDPMEFIAISEAKQFHDDEYDDWANYIPMERTESTWDLYYVLLVEYRSDIAYRVGLGKMYKEAFENSCKPEGKKWKEFILG